MQRKGKALNNARGAVLVPGLARPLTAADGKVRKGENRQVDREAQAVGGCGHVISPALVRGGVIIGAEHGKGVTSLRNQTTRRWIASSFVQITGGSIGGQIGAQSSDMALARRMLKKVSESAMRSPQ